VRLPEPGTNEQLSSGLVVLVPDLLGRATRPLEHPAVTTASPGELVMKSETS